jgi:hypothetical protein
VSSADTGGALDMFGAPNLAHQEVMVVFECGCINRPLG